MQISSGSQFVNVRFVVIVVTTIMIVFRSTRSAAREDKQLVNYLELMPSSSCLENCYEAEGPFYQCTLSLLVLSPARWNQLRLAHLRRLIVLAHQRYVSPSAATKTLTDVAVKDYSVYKSALIFFGLVDCIYKNFFKKVNVTSDEQWPTILAEYIRHNDEAMLKASERVLATYRDELLPCVYFEEYCDAVGLLGDIPEPALYISDVLQGLA